jgi:hypothetical protein
MSVQEECAHLRELIEAQQPLLTAVAEESRTAEDADPDYRRVHVELQALLKALEVTCFCPWPNAHGWYWHAQDLGDPQWREWLTGQVRTYHSAFEKREKGPAPFKFVPYERRGEKADVPFDKWRNRLPEHKRIALQIALEEDLAYEGAGVADDKAVGRWIQKKNATVLEFKIRQGGKSAETEDGKGCPFGLISLRVWCRVQDGEIVLLHGHDKGDDVNGEEDAIDIAITRLKELQEREKRVAKDVRLGRNA